MFNGNNLDNWTEIVFFLWGQYELAGIVKEQMDGENWIYPGWFVSPKWLYFSHTLLRNYSWCSWRPSSNTCEKSASSRRHPINPFRESRPTPLRDGRQGSRYLMPLRSRKLFYLSSKYTLVVFPWRDQGSHFCGWKG